MISSVTPRANPGPVPSPSVASGSTTSRGPRALRTAAIAGRPGGAAGFSGCSIQTAPIATATTAAVITPTGHQRLRDLTGVLSAATSENMAERTLKRIVERQREVLATAAKQGEKMDEGSVRTQLQGIVHEYELLLRDNPNFAAGHAAYGYLLSKVDMRKEAAAMLLKANQPRLVRHSSRCSKAEWTSSVPCASVLMAGRL